MKISESSTASSRICRIAPFDGYITEMVTVSQHASLVDWTWGEAMVNWSSIGGVTSDRALFFVEALKFAAAKADEWNRKYMGTKMEGK